MLEAYRFLFLLLWYSTHRPLSNWKRIGNYLNYGNIIALGKSHTPGFPEKKSEGPMSKKNRPFKFILYILLDCKCFSVSLSFVYPFTTIFLSVWEPKSPDSGGGRGRVLSSMKESVLLDRIRMRAPRIHLALKNDTIAAKAYSKRAISLYCAVL